ncbi:hypothetical protein M758_4G249300 [Ceratodon purpureus]|uniref:shikimate kinase n=1 Tax=Ceratodon purpureus TaxID=3225 RepID=A0A8T0IER3_CERPU|nr:hypothetical protein KC19_4G244600 [Ceratodon purpureus]KAG0620851.1 hypothetical protein M758_4G249300 [Ceratodon purpureus]
MAAVMLGRNVVLSGVSCGVISSPRGCPDWESSSVRVSLERPGVAALPGSSGRRIAAQPSGRWALRAALKELSVDNDVVALPTRNALQVHKVEKRKSGDDQTGKLSEFESLLEEKSEELSQEVALRSQNGIAIYLIGMMASGKSIVGREVAKALNYKFFDSDNVIESYEGGKPCREIFVLLGETKFRNLETKALQMLSEEKCLVVATGGGAVCKVDNWKYLNGVTVWLDVPVEDLVRRLNKTGTETRPLLSGKCAKSELSRLMRERRPHYAKAHCRLSLKALAENLELTDVGALTPTAIAVQVLEEVKQALQQEKYIPPPSGH